MKISIAIPTWECHGRGNDIEREYSGFDREDLPKGRE